jgi:hypothetical protein
MAKTPVIGKPAATQRARRVLQFSAPRRSQSVMAAPRPRSDRVLWDSGRVMRNRDRVT